MPLRLRFEDGRPVAYDACPNCGTARDTEGDAPRCPVCDVDPDADGEADADADDT